MCVIWCDQLESKMGRNGCTLNFSIHRNTSILVSGLQITISHRALAAQDFLMSDQRSFLRKKKTKQNNEVFFSHVCRGSFVSLPKCFEGLAFQISLSILPVGTSWGEPPAPRVESTGWVFWLSLADASYTSDTAKHLQNPATKDTRPGHSTVNNVRDLPPSRRVLAQRPGTKTRECNLGIPA